MSDRPQRAPDSKRQAVSYSQIPEQAPAVPKGRRAWLALAVALLAGWAIMQIEILGGRVLAPFFGYSIYQWGALIGIVMAALAAGYALGNMPGAMFGAAAIGEVGAHAGEDIGRWLGKRLMNE